MKSRFLAVAALAGAALLATAAVASAAPRQGVVVNWRAKSHVATVASGGKLLAIHSAKAVRPGAKVRIAKLSKLSNGTFRARLVRSGKVRTAHFRAQVSGRVKGHVVLSAHGTTFIVKTARVRGAKISHEVGDDNSPATTTPGTTPPAGGAASCATPPPTGQYVIADVTITSTGELECDDMNEDGAAGTVEIEGTVTALGACAAGPSYAAPAYDPSAPSATPGMSPICVALEDDGVGAAFTLLVPDPAQFAVGNEIEARATPNPDGTFTLVSAEDEDGGGHHGGGGGEGSDG